VRQVVVLAGVAAELCSGFRGMRFRKSGDNGSVGEALEKLSGNWHVILDEVIAKHYISPLMEYCRQFERDKEFVKSRYAEKIRSELYWIKRHYLTPCSYTGSFKGSRPSIQKKIPKLFETVEEMTRLLSRVLITVEEGKEPLLENPEEPFHFEVPGYVPLRVKAVLQRKKEAVSNLNLVKIIHGITGAQDFMVNNPESWFYQSEEQVLFRSDYLNDSTPIYAVDPLERAGIIRSFEEKKQKESEQPEEEDFDGPAEAVAFPTAHLAGSPSAITFWMKKSPEPGDSRMLATFIHRQVRDWIDRVFILKDGLILLVLPETGREDACTLAWRLITGMGKHSEHLFSPGAGVTAFRPGSSVKDLLNAGAIAAGKAVKAGTETVILYKDEENLYVDVKPGNRPSETSENNVE